MLAAVGDVPDDGPRGLDPTAQEHGFRTPVEYRYYCLRLRLRLLALFTGGGHLAGRSRLHRCGRTLILIEGCLHLDASEGQPFWIKFWQA